MHDRMCVGRNKSRLESEKVTNRAQAGTNPARRVPINGYCGIPGRCQRRLSTNQRRERLGSSVPSPSHKPHQEPFHVHRNNHIHRHCPAHREPVFNPTRQHPDSPTRTLRRLEAAHDGGPRVDEGEATAGHVLTARDNTKGSRPVMATCSPRVGIRLASLCQARLRRRNIE